MKSFITAAVSATLLAMDWERMIPGHPGPGDRLGTKQDAQTSSPSWRTPPPR